jgi:hypothetical protein
MNALEMLRMENAASNGLSMKKKKEEEEEETKKMNKESRDFSLDSTYETRNGLRFSSKTF